MYRFLDKRFYHKSRWEFDLVEFACEHIGLSRNYDTGQLKRRLQSAITELESVGFLEALPTTQRYVKISRGEWRIVFVKKAVVPIEPPSQENAELAKQLVERGVTPSVANELVREYPKDLIEMQIAVLDRLQQDKTRDPLRNPAGYLVKSIREGYVLPPNLSSAKKKRAAPVAAPTSAQTLDPQAKEIDAYLVALTPWERSALEQEALKHVESTLAEGYRRSQQSGGATFSVYRRMVLEREAKRVLSARQSAATNDAA